MRSLKLKHLIVALLLIMITFCIYTLYCLSLIWQGYFSGAPTSAELKAKYAVVVKAMTEHERLNSIRPKTQEILNQLEVLEKKLELPEIISAHFTTGNSTRCIHLQSDKFAPLVMNAATSPVPGKPGIECGHGNENGSDRKKEFAILRFIFSGDGLPDNVRGKIVFDYFKLLAAIQPSTNKDASSADAASAAVDYPPEFPSGIIPLLFVGGLPMALLFILMVITFGCILVKICSGQPQQHKSSR